MEDNGKGKLRKVKEGAAVKAWDNPQNPEDTHDQRDTEQIQRQIEEARRRKDNLKKDKN